MMQGRITPLLAIDVLGVRANSWQIAFSMDWM